MTKSSPTLVDSLHILYYVICEDLSIIALNSRLAESEVVDEGSVAAADISDQEWSRSVTKNSLGSRQHLTKHVKELITFLKTYSTIKDCIAGVRLLVWRWSRNIDTLSFPDQDHLVTEPLGSCLSWQDYSSTFLHDFTTSSESVICSLQWQDTIVEQWQSMSGQETCTTFPTDTTDPYFLLQS